MKIHGHDGEIFGTESKMEYREAVAATYEDGIAKGIEQERVRCVGILNEQISGVSPVGLVRRVVQDTLHRILQPATEKPLFSITLARRTCPKCKDDSIITDGYCIGICREITMLPMPSTPTPPEGFELIMDRSLTVQDGWIHYNKESEAWMPCGLSIGCAIHSIHNNLTFARPIQSRK